jgi:glycosyltransferase involved in cell wall biosynthesis
VRDPVSRPVDCGTSPTGEIRDVEFSMAVLCYRAEEAIVPFVHRLHRSMAVFGFPWELVLVANYWPDTPDRTPEIVRKLADELPHVRYIAKPKHGGMGWDMKMGLDLCRGRFIGIIDGDDQYPMESIFSCFARIKADDEIDFVKTYRVFRSDGVYRNIISTVYNLAFQLLFPAYRGYRDVNSKPKIMKREAYERMTLHSVDWFLDAELILEALRLRLRIYEVPIRFNGLRGRTSFVQVSTVSEFVRNLIVHRRRFGTGP